MGAEKIMAKIQKTTTESENKVNDLIGLISKIDSEDKIQILEEVNRSLKIQKSMVETELRKMSQKQNTCMIQSHDEAILQTKEKVQLPDGIIEKRMNQPLDNNQEVGFSLNLDQLAPGTPITPIPSVPISKIKTQEQSGGSDSSTSGEDLDEIRNNAVQNPHLDQIKQQNGYLRRDSTRNDETKPEGKAKFDTIEAEKKLICKVISMEVKNHFLKKEVRKLIRKISKINLEDKGLETLMLILKLEDESLKKQKLILEKEIKEKEKKKNKKNQNVLLNLFYFAIILLLVTQFYCYIFL